MQKKVSTIGLVNCRGEVFADRAHGVQRVGRVFDPGR